MKMAINELCPLNGFDFTSDDIELDPNIFTAMSPLHDMKDPLWPSGPPDRTCYKGPYNFSVEVNSTDVNKKKYLFSHTLNRIYVDMECDFSVHFNWHGSAFDPTPSIMYVRATVVFSDDAQAEKRVERCLQHYHQNFKLPATCRSFSEEDIKTVKMNVLHSSRELGTAGVTYCGKPDAADSWLSVVVELNKTGPQPIAHAYKFVCKNSCSNGINRRAIAIIFTLENSHGQVFGREMVGARVCACPRRDMYKDEKCDGEQRGGKRQITRTNNTTHTKKIKIENTNDSHANLTHNNDVHQVITLPPLQVIGSRAMITGLEVMLSMMQQSLEQTTNPALADTYQAHITKLTTDIEDLKKTHQV